MRLLVCLSLLLCDYRRPLTTHVASAVASCFLQVALLALPERDVRSDGYLCREHYSLPAWQSISTRVHLPLLLAPGCAAGAA
jgi:hypothetical protein